MFHDHLHCMSIQVYNTCIHLSSVYSCLGAHTAPSRCIVILCPILPTYTACYLVLMCDHRPCPLLYWISHVFSCVFLSCRMDGMLSTGLQRVAMSALSSTLHRRCSLYSTVLATSGSPCCTYLLKKAMLKWFNFWSMNTNWTPLLVPRCMVRHEVSCKEQ